VKKTEITSQYLDIAVYDFNMMRRGECDADIFSLLSGDRMRGNNLNVSGEVQIGY